MALYTSVADAVAALANGSVPLYGGPRTASNATTNAFCSLWNATLNGGTYPAAGLGSAVTLDRTTLGAMGGLPKANGSGAVRLHSMHMAAPLSGGVSSFMYILMDRLAHVSIANNQATGNISPALDGTARLASGEGGLLFAEVSSALSASTNNFTLTYTNQAGTASRVTPTITTRSSGAVATGTYSGMFLPLAVGDVGVRSVESWTLSSGTATGTNTFSIVKPIACISGSMAGQFELNFLLNKPMLPKIHDSACLFWVHFDASTAWTDIPLLIRAGICV